MDRNNRYRRVYSKQSVPPGPHSACSKNIDSETLDFDGAILVLPVVPAAWVTPGCFHRAPKKGNRCAVFPRFFFDKIKLPTRERRIYIESLHKTGPTTTQQTQTTAATRLNEFAHVSFIYQTRKGKYLPQGPKDWLASHRTPPPMNKNKSDEEKSGLRFAIKSSPSYVEAILRMLATELPDSVVVIFVVDIETPHHGILSGLARAA